MLKNAKLRGQNAVVADQTTKRNPNMRRTCGPSSHAIALLIVPFFISRKALAQCR